MKETKNYDESEMFSEDISHAIDRKKDENATASIFKRMVDGEPKMRLYGFLGVFKSSFFDTEEELIEYIKNHDTTYGDACVIEFLGNVANCSDVIRIIYRNGKKVLCTAEDEDGYKIYNHERSIYRGEFIWEYRHGSIRKMYSAFREREITFDNDVYGKIDAQNQKFMQKCREKNLFNMGKK